MTSDATVSGFHVGDVVAGKYRIDKIIGVGGMGVVMAAHHLQLDKQVAIKCLFPAMLAKQDAVARFTREARAAAKLTGEHVVRVLDVDTLANGTPYMVMELLDGADLEATIQRAGAPPLENAVEIILQTCVALAEAHACAIVHRDLKPANLFCTRRADGKPIVKVLDFGISKAVGLDSPGTSKMTGATTILGSPLYMSPEQIQFPSTVDARTDIWSLGVILYEVVTGRPPFEGETAAELFVKVATQPPTPIRALRPNVPQGIESIILKCLEKDREKRYCNVAEFASALLPFASPRTIPLVEQIASIVRAAGPSRTGGREASTTGPSQGEAPASRTGDGLGRTTLGLPRPRRLLAGGLAAFALLAIAALAVLAVWRRPPQRPLLAQGSSAVATVTPPPAVSDTASGTPAGATSNTASGAPASATSDAASGTPAGATSNTASGTPASATSNAAVPASLSATPPPESLTPGRPTVTRPAVGPSSVSRTTAAPAKSTRPAHDCNPNYYFDDQGEKHFKPECFP